MNLLKLLKHQKKTTLPTDPTEYPAGTFIETEAGHFYVVNTSKRYRITSRRCLASWRPHRVVQTTEAAAEKYRISSKLKFRNGSLIWNISDGTIYLIESGLRRRIISPDALTRIGAVYDDAVPVSLDEIKLHDVGEDLK